MPVDCYIIIVNKYFFNHVYGKSQSSICVALKVFLLLVTHKNHMVFI